MTRFDFGIITNGRRPAKLRATLDSIWAQDFEVENINVFVCGDTLRAKAATHMDYAFAICAKDAADKGLLGEMRNRLVEKFRQSPMDNWPNYERHVCVITDDDMLFAKDFCRVVMERKDNWDILCPRIENPDGTRYWDWAVCGERGHHLVQYKKKAGDDWYNTGGLCVAKAEVFDRVRWPEDIPINNHEGGGKNEDLTFSQAVKNCNFRIKCEPKAIVVHDNPRITSKNRKHLVAI